MSTYCTHPTRSRPDIKRSTDCATREQHRRRSTNDAVTLETTPPSTQNKSFQHPNPLSQFRFFENDLPTAGIVEQITNDHESPHLIEAYPSSGILPHHETDLVMNVPSHPRPISQPLGTSKQTPDHLYHPSGSPVLKRDLTLDIKFPVDLGDGDDEALGQPLKDNIEVPSKEFKKDREIVAYQAGSERSPRDGVAAINKNRSSVSSSNYSAGTSTELQTAEVNHVVGENLKIKVVDVGNGRTMPKRYSPGPPNDRCYNWEVVVKETSQPTQDIRVQRKSLATAIESGPESPTRTLQSAQAWLKNLADQESDRRSAESVIDTEGPDSESSSQPVKFQSRLPHKPTASLTTAQTKARVSGEYASSSSRTKKSSLANKKLMPEPQKREDKPLPTQQPKMTPRDTPGPRPTSPPIHRNAAESSKPVEDLPRDEWTLYNLSCWTDKGFLKTLLKGPTFEFRIEPEGEPFLTDVSQRMLKHFCGKKHVARLVRVYSLVGQEKKEGQVHVLVFPEYALDSTAVMRIIRYMRRCCVRTTTIMKPHFQLHAPPSIEENIETIRACNIFGLYADARRIQRFLVDKKIPGGKITMDDVEVLWEGYDGGLRNSAYQDALLAHIIYNVLGKDSRDREDFVVLLQQEEYAELRELLGTELGIKKRAVEPIDMFKQRKARERQEIVEKANGRMRKPFTILDKMRAEKPLVQGRLLRMLSYDALLEADTSAETRYKSRPEMFRKSTASLQETEDDDSESAGQLYQDAVKEIKEASLTANPGDLYSDSISEAGEEDGEVSLPPKMSARPPRHISQARIASSGKGDAEMKMVPHRNHPTETRPPVPPKEYSQDSASLVRESYPITSQDSGYQATETRKPIGSNFYYPLATSHVRMCPDRVPENWGEIEKMRRANPSMSYYTEEELNRFIQNPHNGSSHHNIIKEHIPTDYEQQSPLGAAAPLNNRPQAAPRADTFPGSGMASHIDTSVGSRHSGTYMPPASQSLSSLPTTGSMVSTTRTNDPCPTCGCTPLPPQKKPSKLQRAWAELREMYRDY